MNTNYYEDNRTDHHEQFLYDEDRRREVAGKVCLIGASTALAGMIVSVIAMILVAHFQIPKADMAYLWISGPGFLAVVSGLMAVWWGAIMSH